MSLPISAEYVTSEVIRRSANYHPSIWGDSFLAYTSDVTNIDGDKVEEHVQLKESVRKMLVGAADNSLEQLNLIDAIQRLGVSYHFESEIETAVQQVHVTYRGCDGKDEDDLFTTSLRFRLLRQQGHNVSCDVFEKFRDNTKEFKKSLASDVRGMLSLYEATHLRTHGEYILDQALDFTRTHLQGITADLSKPLAEEVTYALKQPIHNGLTRLEARHFIYAYEMYDLYDKVLLKFAKLDFNIVQKIHQKELGDITSWWKNLDFAKRLPFARDRVVECYFWILGVYFEPQYFLARKILTRVIALTSVIDDIYDVYGTLEELALFTDAIERWDSNAKVQLPEYMKLPYQALLDVYTMAEEEMAMQGRSYRVNYAKQQMKELVRAYFDEAKWFHEGYVPKMEEYMSVALVTGAYKMLATTSLVGMGDLVTKEAFDWITNDPLIVIASSVICRLMDDMAGHKFEQRRGHSASAVECYMKEYGVSEDEVLSEFRKRVANSWKDVNAACLRPTLVPMPVLTRVLNLARVIDVIYKDEDGYTHSGTKLKGFITSVLVEFIPI